MTTLLTTVCVSKRSATCRKKNEKPLKNQGFLEISTVFFWCSSGDVNPAHITLTQYLIYLPAGSSYAPLDYVAGVNDGDSKNGVTAESAVNTQVPGVYEVVFSYRSGNTESHTRQIVVVE